MKTHYGRISAVASGGRPGSVHINLGTGRAPGGTDRLSLPRVKRPRLSRPRCSPALSDEPVSDTLAAELQEVLDRSANGEGLTATVISPAGTWRGATGFAAGDRAMVPNDQMSIAHITQTVVAAQVMQLVDAGELNLDDLAADRLPPSLEFELNGETIADLLGHRSGFRSDTIVGSQRRWNRITSDPSHAWTTDELLGTVGPERGPVGQAWEYRGIELCAARLDSRTRHGSTARKGAAERGPRRRRVRASDLSARRAADRSDSDAVWCRCRHIR